MAFMYTEGTSDYIAATPVLIVGYRASGSITAGRIVQLATDSGDVYVPLAAGVATGSTVPTAGLATATTASGDSCPVLVWGMAKNLTKCLSTATFNPGDILFISGAGYVSANAPGVTSAPSNALGRVVSGSGTYVTAFISLMK